LPEELIGQLIYNSQGRTLGVPEVEKPVPRREVQEAEAHLLEAQLDVTVKEVAAYRWRLLQRGGIVWPFLRPVRFTHFRGLAWKSGLSSCDEPPLPSRKFDGLSVQATTCAA
jgi:hypothetical protein